MAYDEALAERIRVVLATREGVTEKAMFGGLSFLLYGNMCVGVIGEELVARLGPEGGDRALEEAHARPMDFTGRPMTGWVMVEPGGISTDSALAGWIGRAVDYVATLPPK